MKYTSKILQEVIEAFGNLPGIGRKSALRIALSLANKGETRILQFSEVLKNMAANLKSCKICHAYSDDEICDICSNSSRNQSLICIVESIRDLMAIEETQQYNGVYHVLNGLISPVDGIGPDQLNIHSLLGRIKAQAVEELIMAIRPSIEGDTTIYYLNKQLDQFSIKISILARGISFGSELEYADEFTLGRSLAERIPYNLQVK